MPFPLWAESIAPNVHWGGLAFPDRDRTLLAGYTVNRFTVFNESGARFNAVNETTGFNSYSVSWTERITALPGWRGNVTFGGGATGDEPSERLQNGFMHGLLGQASVPIGQKRDGTDFMFGGSLTRWSTLFSAQETGFAGIGVASGSLYQEVYGRIGFRHLSLADVLDWLHPGAAPAVLRQMSRFLRMSAMGRYGRLYGGSAYPDTAIAQQSYLAQVSVSLADYAGDQPPRWGVEFAATIDSGLFASAAGHSIERRFGSIAFYFPYGIFETWNDVVGGTDSGPTYGFHLMLDVLQLQALFGTPS